MEHENAQLLLNVADPQGNLSVLAVPITRALREALDAGDALRRGGASEVVVDVASEGVLLDDLAITRLEQRGYEAGWRCRQRDTDETSMVVTPDDSIALGPVTEWGLAHQALTMRIQKDWIRIGVSTRDWDTTTFEMGAEPNRDDELQGAFLRRDVDAKQLLEWVAQYAPAPPASPTVLDLALYETSNDLVKVADSAAVTITPDLVSAVESAHRALTRMEAEGTPVDRIVLDGSRWFDFGVASMEAAGIDLEDRDDSGAPWLIPGEVFLDVEYDAIQFVGEEMACGDGSAISERVAFADVPELQHLAPPASAPAPGM